MRNLPRYEPEADAAIVETTEGWPLHERYRLTVESDDQPTLEIAMRVLDGRPIPERVTLTRAAEAGGVTAGDVTRLNLSELYERIASDTRTVYWQGSDDPLPVSGYGAAALAGLRRKRSDVTPARLRDVAMVYGELWDDALPRTAAMTAVAKALGVSLSQSYRLVARARTEIDPTTGRPYISTPTPTTPTKASK